MKIKSLILKVGLILLCNLIHYNSFSQVHIKNINVKDSLEGFIEEFNEYSKLHNLNAYEYQINFEKYKREFIKKKYRLISNSNFDNKTELFKNFIPQNPSAAPCNNEDFETGTFAGWTVTEGSNSNSCTQGGCCPNPGINWSSIFTTPAADPNGIIGTIPNSPLGGTKVALLNGAIDNGWNYKVTRIQQTFPVTANNALFQFAFMAALENAGHTCCDQPFAQINLLDCSGNQLPCPTYSIIAPTSGCSSTFTGWTNGGGWTYTSGWQISSIDLTPYIGSCVTIRVTVGGCNAGGHGGYMFFDALCNPLLVNVNGIDFPVGTNGGNVPACGITSATVSAPPFLAPYTWNGPPGSGITNYPNPTFTTGTAGIYTLTMNPPGACAPITRTINIQFFPNPNATFISNNICNTYTFINTGDPAPSVQTYSFAGASPPASFTTTSTNTTIIFPATGTYTVYHSVTNTNSCVATETIQITVPTIPTVNINVTNASCTSGGSGTVSVVGGTSPFNYTWSPSGGNSNTATNLPQGNYTVYVSDNNGCTGLGTATITAPGSLTASAVQINSVTCNGGANGSATVNIVGGTPTFTYTWSNGNTTSNPTGLTAGFYTVVVTDANNCQSTSTVQIIQPPALSINVTSNSVSCNGGSNGTATASVSGGVGGYSYNWLPSGGSSSSASGLSAGTYTVNVTDANGCAISGTTSIIQPPALSIIVTSNSVSCNGGSNGTATASVNGGVGGYNYNWLPSGGSSSTASGLGIGNYTVNVTDANGCTISGTTSITQPPALSITATSTNVSCFGYADGSASVSVSGGVGGYTYNWSPSGGISSYATGLVSANYTVSVSDMNSCVITTVITITQPSSVSLVTSPNATICFGQSTNIFANASGGTAPYTYSWTPSSLTGSGPISVNPTVTTVYNVYATDAKGCPSPTKNIQIYVYPQLLANGTFTTVCDKQSGVLSFNLTSNGNGGPYQYIWSNGATTPSITVTGNYATQPQTYTVTIDDGCTVPSAVAVSTLFVNPPPHANFSGDLLKGCVPLTVNFTAISNGGSSDSFVWNFGNGESGSGNPATTTYTNTGVFSVTVEVTNQYGCKMDTSIQNYIQVYPYPIADFTHNPLSGSIVEPHIDFFNTSVGATSYTWNFGDYASSNNISTSINPSHDYLNSGTYYVTLIAVNQYGCENRITKPIYIDPEFHIYIPNVFTPDGNGLNDVFNVKGVGIDENNFKMYIFDRWGEMIFSTSNLYEGWDGSVKGHDNKATQDVYVYKIYLKDLKGGKHEFVGHVTCLPDWDKQ
ncbi:MAG TPA: gliding motility-associated C-terminal domain-containing protein [Bacteroidia bacterium]|nr:gliding motility-associated C-terminal domain-containing protein [Bacteroidia bacterium]